MFRKYLAIPVWLLLIQSIAIGFGQIQNPCPNVFQYVRTEGSENIEGRIEIRGVPKVVTLRIILELSVATSLPTTYVGKLELAVSKELSTQAVQQGGSLIYRVHFPVQHPLPLVSRILFNDREYCSGRRAIGAFVTTIVLEHTFYPFGVTPPQRQNISSWVTNVASHPEPEPVLSIGELPQDLSRVPLPYENSLPSPRPPLPPLAPLSPSPSPLPDLTSPASYVPYQDVVVPDNCGRPSKIEINLLVAKGEKTEPGDWPWLVAIFVSRINLEFRCAGSVISNKHVLTAGHCLRGKGGKNLPVSTLLAVLGRYRLRNWAERDSVTYEISEYKLYAEHNRDEAGYDGDLAVMSLMETITFGKLIAPICLWSGPEDIESVVGRIGFVVGWGRDELGNPVTTEPRVTKEPIVSQEECLRSNVDFVHITSNRTFCGGARNGSGPCNGDSGSGLAMWDSETRRYYLRGIVSLSLLDRDTGACDLTQFIVYTDVAKYTNWILEQIAALSE